MSKSCATGLQDYERRDLVERVLEASDSVRRRGDAAVGDLAARDGVPAPDGLIVTRCEIARAIEGLDPRRAEELRLDARRARRFADAQRGSVRDVETDVHEGLRRGLFHIPVDSVALLLPRVERSALATINATIATARAAGVARIVACVPPAGDAAVRELLVAAIALAGVEEIYWLTGVHGVAALAVGTETLPRVDLIVGPAEPAVSEAKRQLFGERAIDTAAAIGDLVVIADDSADPATVAGELLHGLDEDLGSRAVLVAPDAVVAERVGSEIAAAPASARAAWGRRGLVRLAPGRRAACELANRLHARRVAILAAEADRYLGRLTGPATIGGRDARVHDQLVDVNVGLRSVPDLTSLWIGRFLRTVPWQAVAVSDEESRAQSREVPQPLFAHR
jgi:sulfopropanediol 3-dehydrogenase